MTPKEAGRHGGLATKSKYGEFKVCPCCGQDIPPTYYSDISKRCPSEKRKRGGDITKARYGNKHFSDLGKRGGRPRKNKKEVLDNEQITAGSKGIS